MLKQLFSCFCIEKPNEEMKFLREKISELEMDLKSFKIAQDLEMKRIEDKLLNQITILTTKIDNLVLLINTKQQN